MRITDLLDKKSVTLDLVASTKMEAIDKMVDLVDLLYKAYKENKKEDLKKLHQYNQTLNSLKEK